MITVEYKHNQIHWVCNTSISTDTGEPYILKEAMAIPNRHLWKMPAISEVNNFLSRKAWITIKRIKVKAKDINPVPVKWVFKSKKDTDGLIRLKSRNVVKGYIQVPGVDYTE